LEETFSSQGFKVLGFYSNNFGSQGGSNEQIDACTKLHGVTFPQFAIANVIEPDIQPVWGWLLSQPNPRPEVQLAPTWNFHKYLISRDGQLVMHFLQGEWPGDNPNDPNDSFETSAIVMAIEAELAK
jgi:glutathione peroxidase